MTRSLLESAASHIKKSKEETKNENPDRRQIGDSRVTHAALPRTGWSQSGRFRLLLHGRRCVLRDIRRIQRASSNRRIHCGAHQERRRGSCASSPHESSCGRVGKFASRPLLRYENPPRAAAYYDRRLCWTSGTNGKGKCQLAYRPA